MSVEVVGVLLGVFAGVMAVIIYVGGFAEQKRANEDFLKAPPRT